jgi:hypothetical protein
MGTISNLVRRFTSGGGGRSAGTSRSGGGGGGIGRMVSKFLRRR